MNSQLTAPFELGSGQTACLLLHGFTGSPWEMRPLGEYLAERGYRVKAPRLPGHGETAEAMEHVTYHDWEKTAAESLLSLAGGGPLFVAGLSMGALLALRLAARYPKLVAGLAVLAPALEFQKPPLRWLKQASGVSLLERFKPRLRKEGSDIENAHVRAEAPLMAEFPTSRLQDLFTLQDLTWSIVHQVTAPTLILMAEQDHVVSVEGGRALEKALSRAARVRFLLVKKGFHIMPRDNGKEGVLSEVAAFFDTLRS